MKRLGSVILAEFAYSHPTSIVILFPSCASTRLGFGDITMKETHWLRCQCKTWVCSTLSPKAQPLCPISLNIGVDVHRKR